MFSSPIKRVNIQKYLLWKSVCILIITILSFIYASPNLCNEKPSIQLSSGNNKIDVMTIGEIKKVLDESRIPYSSLYQKSVDVIQICFSNKKNQIVAASILEKTVGYKYVTALTVALDIPHWLSKLGAKPMNLGLDLSGGIYLIIEVDTQFAVNRYLDSAIEHLEKDIKKKLGIVIETKLKQKEALKIDELTLDASLSNNRNSNYIALVFKSKMDVQKVMGFIKADYSSRIKNKLVYRALKGTVLLASLNTNLISTIKKEAAEQTTEVIRSRVDELGITEALITTFGESKIIIEFPGLQNSIQAKQILGGTSTVDFYIVTPVKNYLAVKEGNIEVYPFSFLKNQVQYYQTDGNPVIRRDEVIRASRGTSHDTGQPTVILELHSDSIKRLKELTRERIGELMGVMLTETSYRKEVLQGKEVSKIKKTERLINVATIQTELGRSFQITGLDEYEANNLALTIRSGILQVPIHITQENYIGPMLGKQNIKQGLISVILAFITTALFMFIYYNNFGLIANAALVLNLILVIAIMSIIPGLTLTLPGIAGVVLNLGMSIDGNVLIFERIREELKNGMSARSAIMIGYNSARSAILDSNITTLLVAIVLFIIGTGAVKGFATTLIIGIITSMFTVIFVSNTITNAIYRKNKRLKKLSSRRYKDLNGTI